MDGKKLKTVKMSWILVSLVASCLLYPPIFATAETLRGFYGSNMPRPFSRELSVQNPYLEGTDVYILQNFLNRMPSSSPINVDSIYGPKTASKVKDFQKQVSLPVTGVVSSVTAHHVLGHLSADDYHWDPSVTPRHLGYKYLVHVPVHSNRSIETTATLYDADLNKLFAYVVRAHGHTQGTNHTWPNFNNSGPGLNEFSSDGNTPTGLFEFDLNSPEPIPKLYGPYPVNRAVKGLKGNAAFLVPKVRHGILMHTGEWHQYAGWEPPQPMPNSAGCIHAWPDSIKTVWQLLVNKCNVTVHENTGGKQPYPYSPQGLLAVENVDTI
eukprot:gb/GECG01008886.1/.p1 GENE.gb/GECG01008886.1/~~gb/GECG01008886.1/.p1  ORF type:complete len:324 (+),score=26.69 gb/GECG01008886.1/:1-972(+)